MNSYIVHFATYTFAMIGFIVLALYIYKKSVYTKSTSNKDYLKVENALKLSPSKTVYIVKAGNERFLIAGDCANTTMLAKLDESNMPPEETQEIARLNNKIADFSTIKNLAKKINRG